MQELRRIEQDILARGKVDSDHLEALQRALYAGGTVGRPAADFLVELHKRVQHPNPGFEHLFYRAIKDHVLADGRIDAGEAAWLRRMLFADGKITDEDAVKLAYRTALCREPTAGELADAVPFIKGKTGDARETALADFCQVLFCLNEFLYAE